MKRSAALLLALLCACAPATVQRGAEFHPSILHPSIINKPLLVPRASSLKPLVVLPNIDPYALQSQLIVVPGAQCVLRNGQPTNNSSEASWTNNTGFPVGITNGWVWVGADSAGVPISLPAGWGDLASIISTWYIGGVVDLSYLGQNATTGVPMAWDNWDRYGPPGSANSDIDRFNYSPNHIRVEQGQVVKLSVACAGPYEGDTEPVTVAGMMVVLYLELAQ